MPDHPGSVRERQYNLDLSAEDRPVEVPHPDRNEQKHHADLCHSPPLHEKEALRLFFRAIVVGGSRTRKGASVKRNAPAEHSLASGLQATERGAKDGGSPEAIRVTPAISTTFKPHLTRDAAFVLCEWYNRFTQIEICGGVKCNDDRYSEKQI